MAGICRWSARILAGCSLVLALAFVIGERRAPHAVTPLDVVLLGFFFAALLGNVTAWRWQRAGAAVALLSGIGFTGLELLRHGRLPGWLLLAVMLAPALLYGCSEALQRRAAA